MSTGELKDDLSALGYDYESKIKKFTQCLETTNNIRKEKYKELVYRYKGAYNALATLFEMHYEGKISLYNDYDNIK